MHFIKSLTTIFMLATWTLTSPAATPISGVPVKLYPNLIPNSKNVPDEEHLNKDGHPCAISRPTITAYIPEKVTSRSAVIICPGGGYCCECMKHEGDNIAKFFNEQGIVAFVLKYRLPSDKWCINKSIAPLQDAQRAVQYVRQYGKQLGYDKVGIMGFSAGGHLAGSAVILGGIDYIPNPNKVKLRPDFGLLIYARVTFTQHSTSQNFLVGKNAPQEEYDRFSLEQHVDEHTSPIFIVQAVNDTSVPIDNAIMLFNALTEKGHSPSMHIYSKGEHGLGSIGKKECVARCVSWMKEAGF